MEALERIKAAIAGKSPDPAKIKVDEDEHGDPIMGLAQPPLAKVLASDVAAAASLIPKDLRTEVVRDLRKGCLNLAPGLVVANQVRCLLHLVEQVTAHMAASKPTPESKAKPAKE